MINNKDKNISHKFPQVLKTLVRDFTTLLGNVVKEESGEKTFELVESIRKDMVTYRESSKENQYLLLDKIYKKLDKKNNIIRHEVARSFTLMLELINACEIAYRTFRLKKTNKDIKFERQSTSLIYVLTAHPTEARTPENIDLFHRIQNIAIRLLENQAEKEYLLSIVKHNIKLAWLLPITRHRKPQVIDEAHHLYSIIFRPDIFNTLLRTDRDLGRVRIRTWVGGDKDGHPGVDERVMRSCLQTSREQFVKITFQYLNLSNKDLAYINNNELEKDFKNLQAFLKKIGKIQKDDFKKIQIFKNELEKFSKKYEKVVGAVHPRLRKVKSILEMFPGLVIPLELREDSEIIAQALQAQKPIAISRMLKELDEIAHGDNLVHYIKGFVISMCESFSDITNAMNLAKKYLKHQNLLTIPIVPLFETAEALKKSKVIVEKSIKDKELLDLIKTTWGNKFEIMLGYSDSSKGMGVLASRLEIAKTMRSLDQLLKKKEIIPIFFHGSGGSIDRGGGSLKEQTAWWPQSALHFYKATIQGEMVERLFATPEVLLSNIDKILSRCESAPSKEGEVKVKKIVEEFSQSVSLIYQNQITSSDFYNMVEKATPYPYLKVLKLGSRPTKRAKAASLDFNSIRAIPWVLCWTQTRTLFPTWWGVGQTWGEFKKDNVKKERLKKAYQTSGIFSSFIRILGFTLSKVDLEVFRLYLNKSSLSKVQQDLTYQDFKSEYQKACQFVTTITGEKNILWFRPWLNESIELRSSMIHPLNILQIIGNQQGDEKLVRTATAGISSGMLTTG